MNDDGTQIAKAVEALAEYGCCKEQSFPFIAENLNWLPPAECCKRSEKLSNQVGYAIQWKVEWDESMPHRTIYICVLSQTLSIVLQCRNKWWTCAHALIAVGYSDRSKFVGRKLGKDDCLSILDGKVCFWERWRLLLYSIWLHEWFKSLWKVTFHQNNHRWSSSCIWLSRKVFR